MAKMTIEDQLKARAAAPDQRAMRGAVQKFGQKIYITFGAIGDHPRLMLQVIGDDVGVASQESKTEKPPSEATKPAAAKAAQ